MRTWIGIANDTGGGDKSFITVHVKVPYQKLSECTFNSLF